jgi:hypothetical protein
MNDTFSNASSDHLEPLSRLHEKLPLTGVKPAFRGIFYTSRAQLNAALKHPDSIGSIIVPIPAAIDTPQFVHFA